MGLCASTLDIPAAERQALEDLYDRCGGREWSNSNGWKTFVGITSNAHGVAVVDRHVVEINLRKHRLVGGASDVDGGGDGGGWCSEILSLDAEIVPKSSTRYLTECE